MISPLCPDFRRSCYTCSYCKLGVVVSENKKLEYGYHCTCNCYRRIEPIGIQAGTARLVQSPDWCPLVQYHEGINDIIERVGKDV